MISWLRQFGWAAPWLFFLWFPIADLVTTDRPAWAVTLGVVGLALFVVAYAIAWSGPVIGLRECGSGVPRGQVTGVYAVAGLAAVLPIGLGASWAGLCIYVSVAAVMVLSARAAWTLIGIVCLVSAAVLVRAGAEGIGLLFLPFIAVLSGFGMRGTRYLVTVNSELREAREELARNAVAEERLRFARDLHDLLGHSLSLIALKSELARRLADVDPARARQEMADVEAAARGALAEVRDAVSGYRQVSCAQAVAESRSALSGAGIAVRVPDRLPDLPPDVDAALGWVVREATTNVLRHSHAGSVTIETATDARQVVLSVTDDGHGDDGGSPPGSGLLGLTERVAALGGRLSAGPVRGGYRLRVEVPLAPGDVAGAPAVSGVAAS